MRSESGFLLYRCRCVISRINGKELYFSAVEVFYQWNKSINSLQTGYFYPNLYIEWPIISKEERITCSIFLLARGEGQNIELQYSDFIHLYLSPLTYDLTHL